MYFAAPHRVSKITQGKRGKGGGFVKATLKNIVTNNTYEKTFTSDEMVEQADMRKLHVTYSWEDTSVDELVFFSVDNFEEVRLKRELIDRPEFLVEGIPMYVVYFEDKPIGADFPVVYDYTIVSIDPLKTAS